MLLPVRQRWVVRRQLRFSLTLPAAVAAIRWPLHVSQGFGRPAERLWLVKYAHQKYWFASWRCLRHEIRPCPHSHGSAVAIFPNAACRGCGDQVPSPRVSHLVANNN